MQAITPFLWFDDQAEQAAAFYCGVFPDAEVLDVSRYSDAGPGVPGAVMTVRFRIGTTEFTALNGGPAHAGFSESVSFVVTCDDEAELDRYWSALSAGGNPIACGWIRDRFGLVWQVIPAGLEAVLNDPDPERARRATAAMLQMTKLDLAAMRRAADGTTGRAGEPAGAPPG